MAPTIDNGEMGHINPLEKKATGYSGNDINSFVSLCYNLFPWGGGDKLLEEPCIF